MYYGYDANTDTIAYSVRTNGVIPVASAKFYRYRLLFTSPDGMSVVPANTSNSTNATAIRNVNQKPINPFGPIYYYSTTAATESGTSVSASYAWLQYSAIGFGYSFNRTSTALTMTPKAPIYIKCAPQPDGSAIIDDAKPYVQELPSTEDGKIYIYLGIAESATACTLYNYHPVYYYKDGAIRLWTNTPESVVDTAMSSSSTNAVQNKVIKEYVDEAISSITIDIDSELDTGSTNPLANSAITTYIYDIEEVTSAALNDLETRKADKSYVDVAVSSITIDVDMELDSGSTNPVANSAITKVISEDEKVISAAFNDLESRKADKSYVDDAVSSITIDVDSELDTGSTNPVSNSAITTYIYDIEKVTSAALNDLNSRKADKSYVDEAVSSITIDVDSELDSASTNPVENRAIWEVIVENEEVISSAFNDLNDRLEDIEDEMSSGVEMESNKISDISYPHVSGSTDTNTYPTAKAAYNEIHPKVKTSMPSGGFEPNVFYRLGVITGARTFTLKTNGIDTSAVNHYYWTFDAGTPAPNITWPSGLTWYGGSAPVPSTGHHYEISVLNNIAVAMEI